MLQFVLNWSSYVLGHSVETTILLRPKPTLSQVFTTQKVHPMDQFFGWVLRSQKMWCPGGGHTYYFITQSTDIILLMLKHAKPRGSSIIFVIFHEILRINLNMYFANTNHCWVLILAYEFSKA